ncbi:MAG: hypothetical protein AAF563_03250 [Pseudomonadota bacterium]
MMALLGTTSLAILVVAITLEVSNIISSPQFDLLFAIACGGTLAAFLIRIGIGKIRAIVTAALLACCALAAQTWVSGLAMTPYLAIVFINGVVAYIFMRSLMPGREPVLLQIVTLMGIEPHGSPAFRRFMIGQCRLWAGLSLLTALCALVAMALPADRDLAGIAAAALIATQVAWFILSHEYANRRYGRPETWRDTLRTMARPTVWSDLEI